MNLVQCSIRRQVVNFFIIQTKRNIKVILVFSSVSKCNQKKKIYSEYFFLLVKTTSVLKISDVGRIRKVGSPRHGGWRDEQFMFNLLLGLCVCGSSAHLEIMQLIVKRIF